MNMKIWGFQNYDLEYIYIYGYVYIGIGIYISNICIYLFT